jgi:ABC-type oligopeptide transport system substrate-binding subunit
MMKLVVKYLMFGSLLFLYNCKSNKVEEHRTVFRYNESKDISTLDPAFARNQVIMRPVAQLFNGLVQMNDSLQVLPCIAKSWTVSKDGLHYTFILRNDVYFHDNKVFENQNLTW